MATSRNLIFLSQLKAYSNEDAEYTLSDDNYNLAIAATTELFETIAGRKFFKQSYVELHNSVQTQEDNYKIYLNNWPVDSVAPFKVYIKDLSSGFTTEVANTLYSLDSDNGILTMSVPLLNIKDGIKVEYTAGFTDSVDAGVVENLLDVTQERALGLSIPVTLKLAALQQASTYAAYLQASLCQDNKNNAFTVSRSFREVHNLNASAMLLFSKYKRQVMKLV